MQRTEILEKSIKNAKNIKIINFQAVEPKKYKDMRILH